MPVIVVKEYTWRQTDDAIIIDTPLYGNPKNVDLFTSDNYIKASYPPFLLELFLWGNILDEESECVLNKEQARAVFTLKKAESGLTWPYVVVQDVDQQTKKERRIAAFERSRATIEERAKVRSEKNQKLQKQAVRAQINLDTAILNKIDMQRDTERKEAMKDFEEWRSTTENSILSNIEGKTQENRKAYRPALKWFKDEAGELQCRELTRGEVATQGSTIQDQSDASPKSPEGKESGIGNTGNTNSRNEQSVDEGRCLESSSTFIQRGNRSIQNNEEARMIDSTSSSEDSETDNITVENSGHSTTQSFIKEINEKRLKKFYKDKGIAKPTSKRGVMNKSMTYRHLKTNVIFDEPIKAVPLPRKNGLIDVTFSERKFPTPARESHEVEEQEWLQKQAEARRQTGFVIEDLRPEELDPQWLKDKGDEFFKAGNYLGAISAYSHGIKLSPKMSTLYSNRSAAHYALGNYFRCTEDCSKALELMVPQCKGNLDSRAKCHARRGAALCKLGSPQHGIPELEAALKLDPNNATVKCDLRAARQYFNIQE